MIARIRGNSKIEGEITVGGAKNSALPILASLVLISEETKIEKVPDISDVAEMISMIRSAGVIVNFEKNTILARAANLKGEIKEFGSSIRASILLLGPLAIRAGHSELRYPGGCSIGKRPIDIHLDGLKQLGILIHENGDLIEAKVDKIPKEAKIDLRFPSVGATEHLMMTSVLLDGVHTEIRNCAKEPEVVDLGKFLISMGAKIYGVGTDRININGVKRLSASVHSIIGDRIETGTYIIGALSSGGMLKVNGISNDVMHNVINEFKKIGAKISISQNSVIAYPSKLRSFKLSTGPYPQFPTDLQPQMTFLACHAMGYSEITETVFENRFRHVDELKKMGANISVEGNKIKITPSNLHGARVVGNDLRETATILLAAATADGPSEIEKFEIIFRGYENLYEKLKAIGVDFEILKIDREVS